MLDCGFEIITTLRSCSHKLFQLLRQIHWIISQTVQDKSKIPKSLFFGCQSRGPYDGLKVMGGLVLLDLPSLDELASPSLVLKGLPRGSGTTFWFRKRWSNNLSIEINLHSGVKNQDPSVL